MPQIIGEKVEDLRVEDGRRLEILSGCGGSRQYKNSRTDNRADAEGGKRPRAQRFLQPVFGRFGVSQELIDTFDPEKLRTHAHRRQKMAKLYPEHTMGATERVGVCPWYLLRVGQ